MLVEEGIEDIDGIKVGYAYKYEDESPHAYQVRKHYYKQAEIEEYESNVETCLLMCISSIYLRDIYPYGFKN